MAQAVAVPRKSGIMTKQDRRLLALFTEHFPFEDMSVETKQTFIADKSGQSWTWLAEQMRLYAKAQANMKKVLKDLGKITVRFACKRDLKTFTFVSRTGLYVELAVANLLGKNVTAATNASIELGKHQILVNAKDTVITGELNPTYLFKESEGGKEVLKQVIASCISAQWGGTEGVLPNNGYASIFYYERADGVRFAVNVHWHSGVQEWYVLLWEFGGREWYAEYVVFSRN